MAKARESVESMSSVEEKDRKKQNVLISDEMYHDKGKKAVLCFNKINDKTLVVHAML